MNRTEAIAAAAKLSPAMRAALVNFLQQADSNDLNCSGVSRSTLRALRNRGFLTFGNVSEVTHRGPRVHRVYTDFTFTVAIAL